MSMRTTILGAVLAFCVAVGAAAAAEDLQYKTVDGQHPHVNFHRGVQLISSAT
jgi:hypothetical protein